MAYRAYLDNSIFFDSGSPVPEIKLTSARLSLEAGKKGTFTFSMAPDNIHYEDFHKLVSLVDVYDGAECIFSGRVYDASDPFNLQRKIVCEGMMAVFSDSVCRPFSYNGTLEGLVQQLLTQHNSQVTSGQQVQLGDIGISDDYIYRKYETYVKTSDRLQDLVDSYGGYLNVRKEQGILYLDWISEFTQESSQSIDFGENLLDIIQSSGADGIYTVLVPLGAEVADDEGNRKRVDITSVTETGVDYIENQDGIELYGRIVAVKTWDDVTTPAALLTKGTLDLAAHVVPKTTIKVTALDLGGTVTVGRFRIYSKVCVTTIPHGIEGLWFDTLKQDLDLLNPSSDKMVIGNTLSGYVESRHMQERTYHQKVDVISADYVAEQDLRNVNNELSTKIETNTSLIEQKSDEISSYVRQEISNSNERISEVETTARQTANDFELLFGVDGRISSWIKADEEGLEIGRSGSEIRTEFEADRWRLVDSQNIDQLTVDKNGVNAHTVNVDGQLKLKNGQIDQWAIRKGKTVTYRTGKTGVNMDDVWIGG